MDNRHPHFSSDTDLWSTPQSLFDALNERFQFTLDVCATHENAKCDRYFTKEEDGLVQPWEGTCWMNPPYGRVMPKWVGKAMVSAERGATVVCLVPSRTDTRWWHDHIPHASEVVFIRGRLKFSNSKNPAPFPSALVVFSPLVTTQVVYWGGDINVSCK